MEAKHLILQNIKLKLRIYLVAICWDQAFALYLVLQEHSRVEAGWRQKYPVSLGHRAAGWGQPHPAWGHGTSAGALGLESWGPSGRGRGTGRSSCSRAAAARGKPEVRLARAASEPAGPAAALVVCSGQGRRFEVKPEATPFAESSATGRGSTTGVPPARLQWTTPWSCTRASRDTCSGPRERGGPPAYADLASVLRTLHSRRRLEHCQNCPARASRSTCTPCRHRCPCRPQGAEGPQ